MEEGKNKSSSQKIRTSCKRTGFGLIIRGLVTKHIILHSKDVAKAIDRWQLLKTFSFNKHKYIIYMIFTEIRRKINKNIKRIYLYLLYFMSLLYDSQI